MRATTLAAVLFVLALTVMSVVLVLFPPEADARPSPLPGGTGGPGSIAGQPIAPSTVTLTGTGNKLVLDTNGLICLNGNTCSVRIFYDTSQIWVTGATSVASSGYFASSAGATSAAFAMGPGARFFLNSPGAADVYLSYITATDTVNLNAAHFAVDQNQRLCLDAPCVTYFTSSAASSIATNTNASLTAGQFFAGGGTSGNFRSSGGQYIKLLSAVGDTGTNIGVKVANTATFTTAGDKIISFYTGDETTERAFIGFEGGIRVNAGAVAQPTCDATHRGQTWYVEAGAGVKDQYEVCAKDAADAFAWRVLY